MNTSYWCHDMEPMLRFSEWEIEAFASRYEYPLSEKELADLRPTVMQRGHLTKKELSTLARWKAPRSAGHVQKNLEDYVCEITRFALSAHTEQARIEVLTNLHGVSWPTASVILHFFHRDPYPILDYRALWSVSLEVPKWYTFGFWWEYVAFCRHLAAAKVDMRTLDKALWQCSKENQ